LVDLTFAAAANWLSVPDKFYSLARGAGITPESTVTQPVQRALGFFLTEETNSGRRSVELRWKTTLLAETLPPPRIRDLSYSEVEAWARLAY
ncbi:MAG TPA: hypothetical protein VJ777_01440, partial [Mycobacterium sp.]|nr:hypothetical protein [Mycobacterium sp.]